MILPLVCAIAVAGDLELVTSQSLEARYSRSNPSQPSEVENNALGDLARFKDAKNRQFTVILSQKNGLLTHPGNDQVSQSQGYVVCRYNSSGVLDRVKLVEDLETRSNGRVYPVNFSGHGHLANGKLVGQFAIKAKQGRPETQPVNIGGIETNKPYFSLVEANYLYGVDPAQTDVSMITLDWNNLYRLKLVPGHVLNSGPRSGMPLKVAVSQSSTPVRGLVAGAYDADGNFYMWIYPSFTLTSVNGYQQNGGPVGYEPTRVVPLGPVSDANLTKMKGLIPLDWITE